MPSTREPLFLPDPDSPLFQETFDFSRDTPANVSNLQEPEDQSEPKGMLYCSFLRFCPKILLKRLSV